MTPAPVVAAYHAVHPAQPGVRADDVIVSPEALEADVRRLDAAGYRFLTAEELVSETGGERPRDGTAILTFDDGWRDGLTVAAPLLSRLRCGRRSSSAPACGRGATPGWARRAAC